VNSLVINRILLYLITFIHELVSFTTKVQERKHIKNLNDDEKGGCYEFRCLEQPVVSGSWKRLYFERRLTKLIESFVPRLSSFDELEQATYGDLR
jgi:hypothetical protein